MSISEWRCRASQVSKLMTGKIGITENQEAELQGYIDKISSGKSLTTRQEGIFNELTKKKNEKTLPKTVTSFLRKEFREMKYNRSFLFINKYTSKGIQCEEDSITLLSKHLNVPLVKNEERRTNKYLSGLPDIVPNKKKRLERGHDVKSSWSLDTFPFTDDTLDSTYEGQNQVYMDLWGCDEWVTAYCLVNATEAMVHNEKMKFFYQMGLDDMEDPVYKAICREIEKAMIFDVERFQRYYPNYQWENEDLDFSIPEEDRVVLFESKRNPDFIEEAKERVVLGREYMKTLE